ncbi:EAL domain-containing protein [Jannaschia sp. M317]|uniref:sensor domain-containing phosphodiesterase n=1 Tax=Jannaschia sp. M317 TaxID=2867011 RepID=UPI0021A7FC19|nr:EAL domain-containing protein [Jannaschia sp. M317]UWQ16645.1 EAL domain-containing protein [Jannaschia sp. M317]
MLDADPTGRSDDDIIIDRALDAVREHLGMPIAYLSEFVGERTVFRNVSAPGLEDLLKPGDARTLDEVYCRHVLSGELPNLIPDTRQLPLARDMPITTEVPIGSHASLPIYRPDGSVYGMFCTLSPVPNPGLNDRDLKVMEMFADIARQQIHLKLARESDVDLARKRTQEMLRSKAFEVVYQPIYRVSDGGLSGFEALCRFRTDPYRTPDVWFEDARIAGLQIELELAVTKVALKGLTDLPRGTRLAINAAPDTVASGALLPLLRANEPDRLTLEITEHQTATDVAQLRRAVGAIVACGTWVAIDDVGSGYSGLQQILRLRPDVLKLDMALVRDIDTDPARRALASALVRFGKETGAKVVAEGVERAGEWHALEKLGVSYAQGWLLARPGPIKKAAPWVKIP